MVLLLLVVLVDLVLDEVVGGEEVDVVEVEVVRTVAWIVTTDVALAMTLQISVVVLHMIVSM